MDLFEPSRLGRMDPSNFGLWVNLEPLLNPELAHILPAVIASFHFPVDERHEALLSDLSRENKGIALMALTMSIHETRHFHDLLVSPYGSVLMRQYTRAALLTLLCRHEYYLKPKAIAVPLSDWVSSSALFEEAFGVPPPLEGICRLEAELAMISKKLRTFERGIVTLPPPFESLNATSILEALAILFQEEQIERVFGHDSVAFFREQFQKNERVFAHYYGALIFLQTALEAPLSRESAAYILLASLFGNYQDPNSKHLRYPKDILVDLVMWLRSRRVDLGATSDFETIVEKLDEYFDDRYGNTLQGMGIHAAKANDKVAEGFAAMVSEYEDREGESDGQAADLLAAFENFRRVRQGFIRNFTSAPLWYCGASYIKLIRDLPSAVIFLECETGIPVDDTVERIYYIVNETRIDARQFPVEMEGIVGRIRQGDVIRGAHILSPRPFDAKVASTDDKQESPFLFKMDKINVELWQRNYEGSSAMLRFLIEGPSTGMLSQKIDEILFAFALVGTRVYAAAKELKMPTIPKVWDSPAIGPAIQRLMSDQEFREAVAALRQAKLGN